LSVAQLPDFTLTPLPLETIVNIDHGLMSRETTKMADNYLVILALVPVTVGSLYYALYKWRYGNFAHIPSALPRNIFIGHLGYTAAEYKNFGSSTVHPGPYRFPPYTDQ
jgi:hypothetical protein